MGGKQVLAAERLKDALADAARACAIGPQHLPPFEDEGSYGVADTVRTDFDLFERRIKYADGRIAAEAIPILRGALELVVMLIELAHGFEELLAVGGHLPGEKIVVNRQVRPRTDGAGVRDA